MNLPNSDPGQHLYIEVDPCTYEILGATADEVRAAIKEAMENGTSVTFDIAPTGTLLLSGSALRSVTLWTDQGGHPDVGHPGTHRRGD